MKILKGLLETGSWDSRLEIGQKVYCLFETGERLKFQQFIPGIGPGSDGHCIHTGIPRQVKVMQRITNE